MSPLPRVVRAIALPHYCLQVEFNDGVHGIVDCTGLILGERAGVFAALREPARFAAVGISYGAVTWDNDLDLDPDTMHEALAHNPRWVLN